MAAVRGGERRLTEGLARYFDGDPAKVLVPIGDDGAVIRPGGRSLVVACDPVVEGRHFAPGTPLRLVGRKVVNRNLSDLAAMGATADYLLASVLVPDGASAADRRALFAGLRAAARAAGCLVVGGDLGGTPGPWTVTVTAIGHLEGRALTRAGLRVGDTLHVTGPLGGSLESGRHLRFVPRLAEGRWLASCRGLHAATDISDGLLLDLWTMLRASGQRGAELDAAAIPLARGARLAACRSGRTALEHALGDGEDHELLFGVAGGTALPAGGPLARCARRPIGVVTAQRGLWLRAVDGSRTRVEPAGYEHEFR